MNSYFQTKIIAFLTDFLLGIVLVLYADLSAADGNILNKTMPTNNFFTTTFYNCANCETVTIIVGDDIDKKVLSAFESLSNKMGKIHMGTTLDLSGVISNYDILSSYDCPSFTSENESFVIFIDINNGFCENIPYEKSTQLAEIIMSIYRTIDHKNEFNKEKWLLFTKRTVSEYADKYEIITPSKTILNELVEYIASTIYKKR